MTHFRQTIEIMNDFSKELKLNIISFATFLKGPDITILTPKTTYGAKTITRKSFPQVDVWLKPQFRISKILKPNKNFKAISYQF